MTIDEIADEMRPFHNHIGIIYDSTLVRLIGVAQDEMDLYYIVTKNDHRENRPEVYYSYVGWFESLKGKTDRYDNIDRVFALNGSPPTEEFRVESLP
jgi:hypothetical protein